MLYIGVDPGASGGLASLWFDGDADLAFTPMPATERDVFDWFTGQHDEVGGRAFAIIERVHAMPGNGVAGMFKFGMSYGGLRMALTATGIPFEAVEPRKWQKALGIPARNKSETGTQFKNRLKAKAQQLFPETRMTLAVCDAVLLAEYCRRAREGKL